ncbi:LPXTG cell wall anchor domain-containing protein [Listeria newyorkensis]|uniref:LPXTG cell wall anchor domain-containing protein n=1 Tax=Listeria newyorkensis TaxID=1497681 RepID=A0A841YTE7_9LIST|nr:LPXTG cell wall anchor domain-containing protein [Listeria newyorkensis]MBC1457021.1 LPXTG cell wall anchor domain-containing protein [Listeria newyorkensis]
MYLKEKSISIALVFGLTFSTVSPVFAEEMTSQQDAPQQAGWGFTEVAAKPNVHVTQGYYIIPADFVQIFSQKRTPVLTYKDGVVAKNDTVGTFETTIVVTYNDGTSEEITVSYTVDADPNVTPKPDPETPVTPDPDPVEPVKPDPETPVTPDPEPEQPVTPNPDPVEPVKPDPETPTKPDPEKPVTPDPKPTYPEQPVKPDPGKPETTVLATAKNNVTLELNDATATPSTFVTKSAANVQLSFKTQPVTDKLGAQSVQITATKGSATTTVTVNYTVVDTTKPFISQDEDVFYVWPGEEWTAEELVNATDNSGYVKVYFQNGATHLDTSSIGANSTVIVAEDASGNVSTLNFQYEVISVMGIMLYSAPSVNFDMSTDTDIYGGTEPDTTLFVITEESEEVLAETRVDYSGSYHAVLDRPLQPGETAYLIAVDDNGGVSDVTHYTYGTKQVQEVKSATISKAPANSESEQSTQQAQAAGNEIVPARVNELPKTGDSSTNGFVVFGLLLSATALLYLRKRS